MDLTAPPSAAVVCGDRRAASRIAVECPARLQTAGGYRTGLLSDISEFGARLRTDNPPSPGITVLLQWQTHEMFCKVAWSKDGACGLNFERPLARDVVLETASEEPAAPGPVANRSNIPLGQKRSRGLVAA